MQRIFNLNFTSEEVSSMTIHDGVKFVLVGRSNLHVQEWKTMASRIICQKMSEAVQSRASFTKVSNPRCGMIILRCSHGKYPTGYYDAENLHPTLPLTINVSVKCPECIGDGATTTVQALSENDDQPPPAYQERNARGDQPFKASPIPPFNIFPGHSWR